LIESQARSENGHLRTVVITVALAYALLTLVAVGLHGMNPLWFAWLDDQYWPDAPAGSVGYDGQFVYAIALRGLDATPQLDNPPYRLQRILLPALARLLSAGHAGLAPWAILFINWLAIVFTTALLGRWMLQGHKSPRYALMYSLYVGTVMAYTRDLTEPLMVSLAIAGILAWQKDHLPLAVALLALSTLAKETALLFVLACAVQAVASRDGRRVLWAGGAVLPMAVWQGLLWRQYGRLPLLAGATPEVYWPLAGILSQLSSDPGRLFALVTVALPALVLTVYAARRLWQEPRDLIWWLVFWHGLALVFLPPEVYDHLMHAGRNACGLVASVALCVPTLRLRQIHLATAWWCLPTFIWLVPILRWAPWP